MAKKVGLKTARKIEFFNGKLDCRLMEYELYDGSKREASERPGEKDEDFKMTNIFSPKDRIANVD